MNETNKKNHFVLKLLFIEDKYLPLLDVCSLMYDIVLAHDLGVILTEKEYSDYKFGRFFWYRGGRPLKPYHSLRTLRIIKESPLVLEVVLTSIGGIWILLQIINKIQNWSLNREKLKLEVEKLREEKQLRNEDLILLAKRREAIDQFVNLIKRLDESPLKLKDIDIKIVEHDDKENE